MATKRKSKAQSESAKEALRRRVNDLFVGATHMKANTDEAYYLAPEDFMAFVLATKVAFEIPTAEGRAGNDWLWSLGMLDNFVDVDSATEFLFRRGVRA